MLDGRTHIARTTGRPWAEVPEGFVVPRDQWTDYVDRGRHSPLASDAPPAAQPQTPCIPPPHRDHARYGPRACNPAGDELFRRERARWYEDCTGGSLEGLDLAEQWRRVDTVARAFRADTRDGRPGTGGQ